MVLAGKASTLVFWEDLVLCMYQEGLCTPSAHLLPQEAVA